MFFLFYVAINLLLEQFSSNLLFLLFLVVSIIPIAAITARRLHDVGSSGWWQLITFIPVIGFVFLLFWLIKESEGDNVYCIKPNENLVT